MNLTPEKKTSLKLTMSPLQDGHGMLGFLLLGGQRKEYHRITGLQPKKDPPLRLLINITRPLSSSVRRSPSS